MTNHIHATVLMGKNVRVGMGTIIEANCTIGENTFIGHNCILRSGTIIGKDCVIGHLTVFEGDCQIGKETLIHAQCHITKGACIEDKVFIAPFFVGANTPRIVHGRKYPLSLDPYVIKRGARIAVGVTVLPGVIIGEDSMVGAGSVVTKDVEPRTIVYGNPARVKGKVPKEELLYG